LLAKNADEEIAIDFTLLRLATALLNQASGKCEEILRDLRTWSGKPIPRLEAWVLEVFELLIDYGLELGLLVEWYREWVGRLSQVRMHWHITDLAGWFSLGKIIQPGEDLLQRLQNVLKMTQEVEIEDPIKNLPEGYRIGIYSLQEAAAQRAKHLLLERNAHIDIRICTDLVFSEAAKAIALSCDIAVLVTTAMKHALSSGLSPYLDSDKIVYPQSSGSTGIVRAIETYLAKNEPQ
jgi:hypothetical protein